MAETKSVPDGSSSMNESMTVPGSARSSSGPSKFGNQGGVLGPYDQRFRQNSKLSKEIRIKLKIQTALDSSVVTIVMSLVTVFALVGVSIPT